MEKQNYQENGRHKASYREKLAYDSVRCILCPHCCILQDGKTGICRTRENLGGELYSLSYENPCSISVDPIEKKPLFHFFPGTEIYSIATSGCNFRCLNCQNWSISQEFSVGQQRNNISPEDVVKEALLNNTKSIAFTYSEPTVFYEYAFEIAKIAREKGIKTVLISNGYINEKPLLNICKWISAANIDLKCFDDSIYRKLTGGRLQPVLNTLNTLRENGVWLEITNLVIPGWSDNPEMIKAMCEWLSNNGFRDTPLHFSRFFPTYKLTELHPTPESSLLKAREIAEKAGIKYVYIGNIIDLHGENTSCPACGHRLIWREGYLVKQNDIKNVKEEKNPFRKGSCRYCGEVISGVWA
jgi:pyruvate formate lyase activating enzyme